VTLGDRRIASTSTAAKCAFPQRAQPVAAQRQADCSLGCACFDGDCRRREAPLQSTAQPAGIGERRRHEDSLVDAGVCLFERSSSS